MISFVNPWGLLALLAVPIIIAIHLFRRRYPVRRVAGLFLWIGATRVQDAGRTRDRLAITPSLLLELLAAILLALILAQPRFSTGRRPHLVVVLDDSASMSAEMERGGTVRQRAIAEIEQRAAELGGDGVLTIVATGRRPVLIAGPAALWESVQEQLDQWQPLAKGHDPAAAWELGAQLAGDEAELLFLTDGPPETDATRPGRMESVAFGEPRANLALDSARWDIDSATGTSKILGHVTNWSEVSTVATVTGTSNDEEQFQRTLTIPAGQTRAFSADIPTGLGAITIRVETEQDHLAIDNTATLVEPRPRIVQVANLLPADHPARTAVERALAAMSDVAVVPADVANLVVTAQSAQPPASADAWWLAIGVEGGEPTANPDSEQDLILVDRQSPLLEGVTFDGVTTPRAGPETFEGTALVTRGEIPLLIRRNDFPTRAFGLNIDFSVSNFAKSPDWPILMSNLVTLVREDLPGLRRWNYRLDEAITLRLPRDVSEGEGSLTLAGPARSRSIARARIVSLQPPRRPGVYHLRDGDAEIATFSVNFHDRHESNLRTRESFSRPPRVASTATGTPIDSLHSWVINAVVLLVLGALLWNWRLLGVGNSEFGVRESQLIPNSQIPTPNSHRTPHD